MKCLAEDSWVMQGIWKCRDVVSKNIYYRIGSCSNSSIFDDPQIPSYIEFWPPRPPNWFHAISKVHKLFNEGNQYWDIPIVQSLFPARIREAILDICIPQGEEHGTLVCRISHLMNAEPADENNGVSWFSTWSSSLHP